ncbi:hypothetical protein ACR3PJ_004605 [Salmonella enterica subsp. enterica serovar Typhimurium]|nr:hypothetical protein [Salmonella enterica subsp. enterica serovar Infantis]EHH6003209.1 hypothetical protein [Salmonella enterica subsp. enterica serovar Infantis]EIP7522084.1 hypothetical protein [Salmonella enterica]EJP3837072.1 hypothetical protein [Salmonella enterica subsp. enterica serovar Infantis]ELY1206685.1 hypothetical protein [Salmonella enterica]
MMSEIKDSIDKILNKKTLSKVFRLAAFVLFEAPIILLLLGNVHNIPFFNFFMSGVVNGAFTDTGYSFYTPSDLLKDLYSGSVHFYLIITTLIVAKVIHSRYSKKIDSFVSRFS